jgi:hypothetical protein
MTQPSPVVCRCRNGGSPNGVAVPIAAMITRGLWLNFRPLNLSRPKCWSAQTHSAGTLALVTLLSSLSWETSVKFAPQVKKNVLITRYDSGRAHGERCSASKTFSKSSPLRFWGSFPKARTSCGRKTPDPLTLNNAASAPARAYAGAARRLNGETIAMMVPVERKGFMERLLGRKAA